MNLNFDNFAHTALNLLDRSTITPDGIDVVTVKLSNSRVVAIREASNVLTITDVDGESYDCRLYDPSYPTLPLVYDKVHLANTARWASLVAEYLDVAERGCYLALLRTYGPRSAKSLFVFAGYSASTTFEKLPPYCEVQVTWDAEHGETKQVSGTVRNHTLDGVRRVSSTFEYMIPVDRVQFVTVLSEYRVNTPPMCDSKAA